MIEKPEKHINNQRERDACSLKRRWREPKQLFAPPDGAKLSILATAKTLADCNHDYFCLFFFVKKGWSTRRGGGLREGVNVIKPTFCFGECANFFALVREFFSFPLFHTMASPIFSENFPDFQKNRFT